MKVCFARVDRIGDFILTLPCQRAWLSVRPGDSVEWLLSEKVRFVGEHISPAISASYINEPQTFWKKILESFKLSTKLRSKGYEQVVAIHIPWWVAVAFFMAGIKTRTGVASQWFSWIFFNKRLRQKRSLAEKNEALYNLDLINFALQKGVNNLPIVPGRITSNKSTAMAWAQKLKKENIDLNRLVVIHPGMGGSARNWPPENYKKLAELLKAAKVSVVVTCGPQDDHFVRETDILNVKDVVAVRTESGEELLGLLSLAKAVVVPSTGVAHLGASLGVPVIGLYSPVRVQSPKRWAPLGDKVQVLVPNVQCPGIFKCLGEKCPHYDCMEQITVDSLMSCVMDKL